MVLRIEFLFGLFSGVDSTEDIAISKSHRRRIQESWTLLFRLCSREAAYVFRRLADFAVPTAHEEDALYVPRSCSARRTQAFSPQVL